MTTQTSAASRPAPQANATLAALDSVDRQLLDIIQTDFPLSPRPYAELGQRLGLNEQEVLDRVRDL